MTPLQETILYLTAGAALVAVVLGTAATIRLSRLRRRFKRLEVRHVGTMTEVDTFRRRTYALAAEAKMLRAGKVPRFAIEFRSEFGEDCLLWELFDGQMEGFFVECGAFDGYTLSVTYAFEAMGWSGVLVEANPGKHKMCVTRRSRSQVVHAAVGAREGGTTAFTIAQGEAVEALSFATPYPGHEKEIEKRGGTMSTVQVPQLTFNGILAGHLGGIDFVVLDVEGGELEALQGFDLGHFRPRVLLVEEGTGGQNANLPKFLANSGYTMAGWIGYNQVHVRNDEREMLRRARELCTPGPMWDQPKK